MQRNNQNIIVVIKVLRHHLMTLLQTSTTLILLDQGRTCYTPCNRDQGLDLEAELTTTKTNPRGL